MTLGCKQSEQRLPWSLLARVDHSMRTLARGLILMVGRVPQANHPIEARGKEDSAEIREEEVSGDADEPPEKRSREEKITSDGTILLFSFFFLVSFMRDFCF